jgi:hypothetical protein
MNKIVSQICLVGLVIVGFVLVNTVAVHYVAGYDCPNVGTESQPCIEDISYYYGDENGPCFVAVRIDIHDEQPGIICYGGSFIVHNVNRRHEVNGS